MERSSAADVSADVVLTRLDVWHPDCWNIAATERVGAGLLCHSVLPSAGRSVSRLTAYGGTMAEVDALVGVARESPNTGSVYVIDRSRPAAEETPVGNATKELLVQCSGDGISRAFAARGFVRARPAVIEDGREEWTLLSTMRREEVTAALDEIRADAGADIEVLEIGRAEAAADNQLPGGLSARQYEVLQLARRRGYYDFPRRTDARALADELGITTSTLHEHLQKVEAKLIGRSGDWSP